MTSHCGFTGCAEPVVHTCALCGMPLCEKHAIVDDIAGDGAKHYCKHCRAYLRRKAGDTSPQNVGRRGGPAREI